MLSSALSYDGICCMRATIDIHGTQLDINVMLDTGFTSFTGFGLKLPTAYSRYAHYTGTGHVRVADNREVTADSIPDAKIIKIEDHQLAQAINLPTIFLDGPEAIGVFFLQKCIFNLNGPSKIALLQF